MFLIGKSDFNRLEIYATTIFAIRRKELIGCIFKYFVLGVFKSNNIFQFHVCHHILAVEEKYLYSKLSSY